MRVSNAKRNTLLVLRAVYLMQRAWRRSGRALRRVNSFSGYIPTSLLDFLPRYVECEGRYVSLSRELEALKQVRLFQSML